MRYRVLSRQYNSHMCFVCGIKNTLGTNARFFVCLNESDEKILLMVATPKEEHQSYPNRMHGGIISALLDESIGRAVQIENPDIWAVTIDLSVKFRKPVPLNQTLYCESKITELNKRTFTGEGKLFCSDGAIVATATAKYFIVPIEKIVNDDKLTAGDVLIDLDEELPEEIVIS